MAIVHSLTAKLSLLSCGFIFNQIEKDIVRSLGNSLFAKAKKHSCPFAQKLSKSKIVLKEAEIAQPQKVELGISNIKNLGYSPRINVEEGTLKCIEFYKEYMKEKGMI